MHGPPPNVPPQNTFEIRDGMPSGGIASSGQAGRSGGMTPACIGTYQALWRKMSVARTPAMKPRINSFASDMR